MKLSNDIIQKIMLIAADVAAMVLSFLLAALLLDIIRPGVDHVRLGILGIAKFGALLLIAIFWYQEQYRKRRPAGEELKLLYQTIFLFAILHMVMSYLISHHVIRLLNIIFWALLLIILPVIRHFAKKILDAFGVWKRDIYIVGTGKIALSAKELLLANSNLGYSVLGFIDLDNISNDLILNKGDYPVFSAKKLEEKQLSDTEVIFALSSENLIKHTHIINRMQSRFLFVSIIPDVVGLPLYGVSLEHFFGNDQMFLRLQNNLGRKFNRWIKRIIDVMITTIAIIMLSPILFAIWLLIVFTSPGKAFYTQKRVGTNGVVFHCMKFRTMCIDSAEKLKKLLESDEKSRQEWENTRKLKNDPRITIVGKFLRKTSLDELPQLFNVFLGDMSLVGPRPIVREEAIRYGDDFYYYKLVKPGITGLWQISGRSDLDYSERINLDVWYVKNWSLWYDFAILVKTIPALLSRGGAY